MTDEIIETPAPTGVSRRTALTTVALGTGAVWAAPALSTLGSRAFAATGSAAPNTGTLNTTNNGGAYSHSYTLTYTCSGGVVSFSGTGDAAGGDTGGGETINGTIDLGALTFQFTSVYANSYTYSVAGPLTAAGAGTYTYNVPAGSPGVTGGVSDAQGTFTGVISC